MTNGALTTETIQNIIKAVEHALDYDAGDALALWSDLRKGAEALCMSNTPVDTPMKSPQSQVPAMESQKPPDTFSSCSEDKRKSSSKKDVVKRRLFPSAKNIPSRLGVLVDLSCPDNNSKSSSDEDVVNKRLLPRAKNIPS
ncbi:unnamed protein product [Cylindrotheca closterium]|uniref:Uncharacterized protein n=1 Tax=Cylindrotheca closterium TaxID=2856 RepID=A0AAD2FGT6_9STRA|nr:unnamed protein product [Cylindrotheca closterium]